MRNGVHLNPNANMPMVWKYPKRYFPDFYMIRLMRSINEQWKPHRNPRNYVKLKYTFREHIRFKAEY